MNNETELQKEAMHMLKQTSRTFYIPISLLKQPLKRTVASAYLCMRAIDEIEDHEILPADTKQHLLQQTSTMLAEVFDKRAYERLVEPYKNVLPDVTLRLADWIAHCPADIIDKVKQSTSTMATGMAEWVRKNWHIQSKEDLDDYTYYVAGLVGVMLSDIWYWHDKTETDRDLAIAFGRGLQAVNILRNQKEDSERGVAFFPDGWNRTDMFHYAATHLHLADEYIKDIRNTNILSFCKIPLALAKKTLNVLKNGKEKLSRYEVETVVSRVTNS